MDIWTEVCLRPYTNTDCVLSDDAQQGLPLSVFVVSMLVVVDEVLWYVAGGSAVSSSLCSQTITAHTLHGDPCQRFGQFCPRNTGFRRFGGVFSVLLRPYFLLG